MLATEIEEIPVLAQTLIPPSELPVVDFRQRILDSVDANQVTIIVAETGAGKSTQIPQYLAEHGYRKVIVTQPRILAARNLSMRVRDEWCARHGESEADRVGYRTAHERDDSELNAILYCTDGLQLVREVTGSGTEERQVLVLDEIHEWNQNMEVLIAWAKRRCLENPQFKVVVMSATIDADSLTAYFNAAKPILIPGRGYPIDMRRGDDLVDTLITYMEGEPRNILVFLPGKSEIENVASRIQFAAENAGVAVLPLHSQLTVEEQQLAFASYEKGKIILSTNIAQTSVTISDIDVVVDSGLQRHSEIQDGVEGLFIVEVSKADCLQRAGRAGRTKPGEYVLAPLDRMPCADIEDRPAYAVPEILRTHLDRLTLRLASVDIDISELEFFHMPEPEVIADAKQTLRNLGALTVDMNVTPLGQKMERFPVESRYSRMLVEAEDLSSESRYKLAAIIAIQEVGGIVRGGSRMTGWLKFTHQSRSDLLAQYDVFRSLAGIESEELEELGIIEKNVGKAADVLERLGRDLGFTGELSPIENSEAEALMRCIVAGQIDQVWRITGDNAVTHISGGHKRELSGGTVVARTGLLVGIPFDLEVPTPYGLETLYLFQDVTSVNPLWLQSLSPETFKALPGKTYFDAARGGLSVRWLVTYKGTVIKGASTAITDSTPQNKKLFLELYSAWLYERLEEDRRRIQKETGRKVRQVSPHHLGERVRAIASGIVSLDELPIQQRVALSSLATMRAFVNESELRGFSRGKRGGRGIRGGGKKRRK